MTTHPSRNGTEIDPAEIQHFSRTDLHGSDNAVSCELISGVCLRDLFLSPPVYGLQPPRSAQSLESWLDVGSQYLLTTMFQQLGSPHAQRIINIRTAYFFFLIYFFLSSSVCSCGSNHHGPGLAIQSAVPLNGGRGFDIPLGGPPFGGQCFSIIPVQWSLCPFSGLVVHMSR